MDANETAKDAIPAPQGQDSKAKTQQDSKGTRTYTEDEVEKKFSQQRSVLDKKIANLEKQVRESEGTKSELEAVKQKLAEYERESEEAELNAARGDPARMAAYQARQRERQRKASLDERETDLKKREAELNKSKAEHEAELKAAQETNWEIELWEIADEVKIDPVKLKDTCKDLNLTTTEQAKALAKRISESLPKAEEKVHIDSGVTSGTAKPLTGNAALADFFRKK